MAANKAQMIPSIRAFIPAPAQHLLHCRGAFRPKDNYFFNVEIIFGAQALTATKIASFRTSASGQSLKRTACPCDGTATNNKRCVVNMAKKLRRLEPRDLALVADLELEGAWRVEYFDGDGAGYVAVFAGQSAEVRARDYYDAIKRGALKTRIADAEVVTAKKVVSFPQKRRRPVR